MLTQYFTTDVITADEYVGYVRTMSVIVDSCEG